MSPLGRCVSWWPAWGHRAQTHSSIEWRRKLACVCFFFFVCVRTQTLRTGQGHATLCACDRRHASCRTLYNPQSSLQPPNAALRLRAVLFRNMFVLLRRELQRHHCLFVTALPKLNLKAQEMDRINPSFKKLMHRKGHSELGNIVFFSSNFVSTAAPLT